LAFKPNTDDIREAPALEMISDLLDSGASIRVYDPEASQHVRQVFGDVLYYAKDMYDAIQDADALALVTEWNVFRSPDFDKMKKGMKQALIFDGRNVFEHHKMAELGFIYYSIGRH